MRDFEGWIYFDAPEPEPVRRVLDEVRNLPPPTPEQKAEMKRRLVQALRARGHRVAGLDEEAAGGEGAPAGLLPTAPGRPEALALAPPPPPALAPLTTGSPGGAPPAGTPLPVSPPVSAAPPATPPAVQRGPAAFAETAALSEQAAALAAAVAKVLPFVPKSSEPDPHAVAKTTKLVAFAPKEFGETFPIGAEWPAMVGDALPFLGNTAGKGVVPFPRMTREVYAGFHAELVVFPERLTDIRQKYLLATEASHAALVAHWQSHFAEHPAELTPFVALLKETVAAVRRWPSWQSFQPSPPPDRGNGRR